MDITEYQETIKNFATYNHDLGAFLVPYNIGATVGTLQTKIANIMNADSTAITERDKISLAISIGDILQQLSYMTSELGLSLEEVIALNIKKNASQQPKREF